MYEKERYVLNPGIYFVGFRIDFGQDREIVTGGLLRRVPESLWLGLR